MEVALSPRKQWHKMKPIEDNVVFYGEEQTENFDRAEAWKKILASSNPQADDINVKLELVEIPNLGYRRLVMWWIYG